MSPLNPFLSLYIDIIVAMTLPPVPIPMSMPIPVSDCPGSNILLWVIERVFLAPVLPQMHPGKQIG